MPCQNKREDIDMAKRKKKSRFGYYLYAFTTLVLMIAIILTSAFILTYVQKIEIEGLHYSTEEEILSCIKEDPYTINSVYTYWKYKSGDFTFPESIQTAKMSFNAPWELKITVNEKEIVGCILVGQDYVYFAEDQTVLKKSTEMLDGIPVVEGLQIGKVEVLKPLQIQNEKVFSYIMNISEEVKENDLKPDRIVWEEESMNLYFAGIRVQLGRTNFDEKVVQLPPILAELEGQQGVLHMEHYSDVSTSISFEKEEKNY